MADLVQSLRWNGVLILYELQNKNIIGFYEKRGEKKDFSYDGTSLHNLKLRDHPESPPPEKYFLELRSQMLLHDQCALMESL